MPPLSTPLELASGKIVQTDDSGNLYINGKSVGINWNNLPKITRIDEDGKEVVDPVYPPAYYRSGQQLPDDRTAAGETIIINLDEKTAIGSNSNEAYQWTLENGWVKLDSLKTSVRPGITYDNGKYFVGYNNNNFEATRDSNDDFTFKGQDGTEYVVNRDNDIFRMDRIGQRSELIPLGKLTASTQVSPAPTSYTERITAPFQEPQNIKFEGRSMSDISNAEKERSKYRFIKKNEDGNAIVEFDGSFSTEPNGIVDGYDVIDLKTNRIIKTVYYGIIDHKLGLVLPILSDEQKKKITSVSRESRDYNFYKSPEIQPIVEKADSTSQLRNSILYLIRDQQDSDELSKAQVTDNMENIADLIRDNKLTSSEYQILVDSFKRDTETISKGFSETTSSEILRIARQSPALASESFTLKYSDKTKNYIESYNGKSQDWKIDKQGYFVCINDKGCSFKIEEKSVIYNKGEKFAPPGGYFPGKEGAESPVVSNIIALDRLDTKTSPAVTKLQPQTPNIIYDDIYGRIFVDGKEAKVYIYTPPLESNSRSRDQVGGIYESNRRYYLVKGDSTTAIEVTLEDNFYTWNDPTIGAKYRQTVGENPLQVFDTESGKWVTSIFNRNFDKAIGEINRKEEAAAIASVETEQVKPRSPIVVDQPPPLFSNLGEIAEKLPTGEYTIDRSISTAEGVGLKDSKGVVRGYISESLIRDLVGRNKIVVGSTNLKDDEGKIIYEIVGEAPLAPIPAPPPQLPKKVEYSGDVEFGGPIKTFIENEEAKLVGSSVIKDEGSIKEIGGVYAVNDKTYLVNPDGIYVELERDDRGYWRKNDERQEIIKVDRVIPLVIAEINGRKYGIDERGKLTVNGESANQNEVDDFNNYYKQFSAATPPVSISREEKPVEPLPQTLEQFVEIKKDGFYDLNSKKEVSKCPDGGNCVPVKKGQVILADGDKPLTPISAPTISGVSIPQIGEKVISRPEIREEHIIKKAGKYYRLEVFKPEENKQIIKVGGIEFETHKKFLEGVDFKKGIDFDVKTQTITVVAPSGDIRTIKREENVFVATDQKIDAKKGLTRTTITEIFDEGITKTKITENPKDLRNIQITETTILADGSKIDLKYEKGKDAITDKASVTVTSEGKTSQFSGKTIEDLETKNSNLRADENRRNQILIEAIRAGIKIDKVGEGVIGDLNGVHLSFGTEDSILTMNKEIVTRQITKQGEVMEYEGDVRQNQYGYPELKAEGSASRTFKNGDLIKYEFVKSGKTQSIDYTEDRIIINQDIEIDKKFGFEPSDPNSGKIRILSGISGCEAKECIFEAAGALKDLTIWLKSEIYYLDEKGKKVVVRASPEQLELIERSADQLRVYGTRNKEGKRIELPTLRQLNSQRFFSNVERVFTEFQGLGYYATFFFDEDSLLKWRDNVDRAFATLYLGTEYWSSSICGSYLDGADEGIAYAETPQGLAQVGAHIEASRTEPITNGTRGRMFIYKITFNVRNGDYAKDPRAPEEMNINVVLRGERTANVFRQTQKVARGSSFGRTGRSAIVQESPALYTQVCMTFDNVPLRWKLDNKELCNTIVESSAEPTTLSVPATSTAVSAGGTQEGEINDF